MSLTTQRPFKLRFPEMAPSPVPFDDWAWTLRATYLCGKVLEFVFAPHQVPHPAVYHELLEQVENWQRTRPVGFDPILYELNNEAGTFPEIRLHLDCHGEELEPGNLYYWQAINH